MSEEKTQIAEPVEIQQILTEIMRGKTIEGAERAATITERLKAIDLMGKTTGLWKGEPKPEREKIEFVGDEQLED